MCSRRFRPRIALLSGLVCALDARSSKKRTSLLRFAKALVQSGCSCVSHLRRDISITVTSHLWKFCCVVVDTFIYNQSNKAFRLCPSAAYHVHVPGFQAWWHQNDVVTRAWGWWQGTAPEVKQYIAAFEAEKGAYAQLAHEIRIQQSAFRFNLSYLRR